MRMRIPKALLPVPAILGALGSPTHAESSAVSPGSSSKMTGSVATREETVPGNRVPDSPDQPPQTADAHKIPFGFSLNPLGWILYFDKIASVSTSAYVGLDHHHAVRPNFTWYTFGGPMLHALLIGSTPRGRMLEAGISWVWYPRRLWDGFMIEAGVVYRNGDLTLASDISDQGDSFAEDNSLAARAMIGWSWLLGKHVFVAVAAGVSAGYVSRHVTPPAPEPAYDRSGRAIAAESYLQLGLAFGR
jgi:hypothetical protein